MKVDAKALFEVVREVVRDEVRKALPQMIAKHLSEVYIKKALAESLQVEEAPSRVTSKPQGHRTQARLPSNLREIIAGTDPDEEVTPEALPNDTMGIYEPANPLIKKNEAVVKLLSRNNPMANIYEGLQPIDAEESTPSIPLNKVAAATGMDFSKMNALVDGLERSATGKKPMALSEDAQMKELERKRRMLEIPVQALPRTR